MPSYEINPLLHKQGGRDHPYEKYHLTETQWRRAISLATEYQDGLAPADVMRYMQYVDPPMGSSDAGVEGMRALDGNYFYLCVGPDTWRRIPINIF